VNNIAKWNGSAWSDVGGGMGYTGATTVSTLTVYNGDLYAGGTFTTAGTVVVKHIAKWDGTIWSDVGGGAGSYTGATTVSTLTVFGTALIAGGSMDSLGSTPVSNIGKWDGSSWSPLGTGTSSQVLTLAGMHDTLYAGGLFLTAGSVVSPFIAKWIPDSSMLFTLAEEREAGQENIMLFPNPAKELLHIKPRDPNYNDAYNLVISDITGREIFRKKFRKEAVITSGEIPAGLYIYKISSENNFIQAGKVVFR
jgi:hypothetical protein